MKLAWDQTGQKKYETGTDHGVLYPIDTETGGYSAGVAWNGLTKVTESPDGAEETALYADNDKYLGLMSAENFKGTIEAYTYPDEFAASNGEAQLAEGVTVGQQDRLPFGFSYRTIIGNDIKKNRYGYKLHIVYGAQVSPSEKGYESVNDSPAAITFSWPFTTTPVEMPNGLKKSATIVLDSTKVGAAAMAKVEAMLYGSDEAAEPKLPTPAEVAAALATPEP